VLASRRRRRAAGPRARAHRRRALVGVAGALLGARRQLGGRRASTCPTSRAARPSGR
jgi:hypothetical protein